MWALRVWTTGPGGVRRTARGRERALKTNAIFSWDLPSLVLKASPSDPAGEGRETSGSQCLILPRSHTADPSSEAAARAFGQGRSDKPALRAYTSVTCFFYFCLPRGPVPSCLRDSDTEATHSPVGHAWKLFPGGWTWTSRALGSRRDPQSGLGVADISDLRGYVAEECWGVLGSGEKGTEGPRGTPTGALLSVTHF